MRNLKFSKYPDIHAMKKDVDEYINNSELGIMSTMPDDYFDNIEFRTEGTNKLKYGYKNGFPYYISSETDIEAMQKAKLQGRYQSMYPETGATIGDVAAATPGFLKDAFNPVNIGKGLNTAVVNFFDFIDNSTGGAVTEIDNFFVKNFPNTLGKKFEYEEPQTPGGVTGKIIGQYVMTDLFLRRVIPFFRKNTATEIAADATTVGLFSSKDEGNIASIIGEMFPDFTNNNLIAKTIIEGLTVNEDDSEVEGRLKNVISDSGALSVIMGLFKIMKSFNKNPEKVEEYIEAQSAGAAATPKEAPTPVEVVDSSGQPIKQVDQTDELVTSDKPFYSNVENAISNFTFKQQPGNQILATLNNTAGIKQSELEDLGLIDFLKNNPNVTKEQLDDFIANKSLVTRVKDEIISDEDRVFLGTNRRTAPDDLKQATSIDDAVLIVKNNENLFNEFKQLIAQGIYGLPKMGESPDDYLQRINKLDGGVGESNLIKQFLEGQYGIKLGEKKTKFESYVTPGGTNYKEMLITVPGTPQVFTDHHFRGEVAPGENLIAHARFNDRIIDNKKILFIEEIQSDLHQAGRKKGYVPKDANAPEIVQQVELLRNQKADILKEIEDLKAKRAFTRPDAASMGAATKVDVIDPSTNEVIKTYKLTGNATQKANIIGEAAVYADDFNKTNGITDEIMFLERDSDRISRLILDARGAGKIADAPFKKNWYELTMKRIIKYAIDNGYDGISFTTGNMQVLRYPGAPNPDGLRGFYDNTLTKVISKFGNKYGAKLEKTNINDQAKLRYTDEDFTEINKKYDAIGVRGNLYSSYKIIENFANPIESRYELIQIKDGKQTIISSDFDPFSLQKEMAEEMDGFRVPQVIEKKKGSEVPIMIFSPDMKKEILQEGVPIAQLEDREKEQQTAVV